MDIGNKLKEARVARGLTLEAVEEETKIRRKYLQAMEEEKFQILPGPIYAKAFLKNYAKFLNLDLEEILEAYNKQFVVETVPEVPASAPAEPVKAKVPGKPRLWIYISAAAVIVGLAFSLYYGAVGMGFNRPADKTTEEARKGEPAQTPPGEQAQTPAGQTQVPGQGPAANATGVNMVLNVKDDRSWILVVADGNPIFQGIVPAGQSKNFDAKERIYIRLGNAGVVEVQVNGQNLGFLGGPGDVVDKEFKAPSRG
ncbi:MAG: DUF4115 domain-containing protein [Firmicutes bacterium]|nr:DUF4115 domain-containing protein [Bacillota bacterium]